MSKFRYKPVPAAGVAVSASAAGLVETVAGQAVGNTESVQARRSQFY